MPAGQAVAEGGKGIMAGLKELVNIAVKLYFEIRDSGMYGGAGSVGYVKYELEQVGDLGAITEEMLQEVCNDMARILKVSPEKVRMVSKEEYDAFTEDDG